MSGVGRDFTVTVLYTQVTTDLGWRSLSALLPSNPGKVVQINKSAMVEGQVQLSSPVESQVAVERLDLLSRHEVGP